MTRLRRRMEEELKLRGYSPATIKAYLGAVKKFAAFHRRPPDQMGAEEVRAYLLYLTQERKLSPSTVNQTAAAIRFFYASVLRRPCEVGHVVCQKRKRTLPTVLSEQEVTRLLDAAKDLKDRAILMTLYSGGLRLLELIRLSSKDVDSARMRIRIREGKGGKERYVILSETLLVLAAEENRGNLVKPASIATLLDRGPAGGRPSAVFRHSYGACCAWAKRRFSR